MSLRIRRGTDLERSTQLFDQGEIVYTTDTQRLYIGDGSTLGGIAATGFTTAEAQDAAASIFAGGSHSGITFTYNPTTNTMDADVIDGIATTYGISAETATGGVNLRLSGSDASTDNVKFAEGSNITLTRTDASTITIASTASGSALTVKNEGTDLTTNATSIDFVGSTVTATSVGDAVTVTIDGGTGGGATTLNDLTDVDVTGAVTGNVLKLNSSGTWEDGDLALADLSDVSASPTTGESLIWSGTSWINGLQPISEDINPQLGGNLDLNGYLVTGDGAIDITTEVLSSSTISITTANDTNTSSVLALSRSNGTIAIPTTVADADDLGGISFSGHDGTGYQLSSFITATAAGTVSTGIVPSRLLIGTTDATGVLATRVTVDDLGGLNALYGLNLISTSDAVEGSSLLRIRRSRGTSAARTTVLTGDNLSRIVSSGYDGANYVAAGSISVDTFGTVSTGIIPSTMSFSTTDTSGNLNTAITIGADSRVNTFGSLKLYNPGDTVGGTNNLDLLRTRGTVASPSTIVDSDTLFLLQSNGFDGTNYTQSSAIRFQHDPGRTISTGVVPGRMTFLTANTSGALTTSFYIDSSQRLFALGGLSVITDDATKTNTNIIDIRNYHASATDTNNISLTRYRGTAAAPAAVQPSDYIYDINFQGFDGTSTISNAFIRARVPTSGTVSTGIVQGALIFGTRNAAGTLTTRMSIDSYVTTFTNMPKLPTFADEAAANTSIGGTPVNGMMYYDTAAGKIKGYQNGAWVILQP